jgi:hypothetical protein
MGVGRRKLGDGSWKLKLEVGRWKLEEIKKGL